MNRMRAADPGSQHCKIRLNMCPYRCLTRKILSNRHTYDKEALRIQFRVAIRQQRFLSGNVSLFYSIIRTFFKKMILFPRLGKKWRNNIYFITY